MYPDGHRCATGCGAVSATINTQAHGLGERQNLYSLNRKFLLAFPKPRPYSPVHAAIRFFYASVQELKEFTLTGECKMVQELLVRLEYGRDWSHHSFFDLGNTRDIQQLGHTEVGSPWNSLAQRELYLRGTRDCSTL